MINKKNKLKMSFIVLLLFSLTFINVSFADSGDINSDKILRIGIDVDNEELDYQRVEAEDKLSLYILANRVEIKLMDLNEKNISFKKADYHVKISDTFASESQMLEMLDQYRKIDQDVFPVYSGGWYIAYGSYNNESDGIMALGSLKNKFSFEKASLFHSDKLIDIFGSKKLVSYNTLDGDFYVKEDKEESILDIGGKKYRNGIGLIYSPNSNFTVVNIVPIDDYLYGVLPKEVNENWHIEALKAQAVAARNFALANINKYREFGFDLCDTTSCQVYEGLDVEKANTNLAVDMTRGHVLLYNNELVQTYFHSNSGGRTESSENIWSAKVPYLKGVLDEYSMFQPNYTWEKSYSADEIQSILSKAGYNIGTLKDVRIDSVSENHRVQSISFVGTNSSISLEKQKIRSVFGYTNIKSIWYSIDKGQNLSVLSSLNVSTRPASNLTALSKDGVSSVDISNASAFNGRDLSRVYVSSIGASDKYTFRGFGFGHGLGMSQYGAKAMAEKGFTYDQILTHYYTGTNLRVTSSPLN